LAGRTTMNTLLKLLIALLIALLFLSTNSYADDKLTVLLDWFANPDHAPLFIAKEHGFFKQQGLDVELIGPADSVDPPKLVAAGKADIAINYQPKFLELIDKGLPLIMIGNLINHPLNCIVAKKINGIRSVTDLKNKVIGYSGGSLSTITLKVMLEHNGSSADQLKLLNVHYALTQALLSDKVDAITGVMRNFEVIQLNALNQPIQVFYPEQNGMPDYSELIFIANKDKIVENRQRFKKFFTALKQAVAYLKAHPTESWHDFSINHPELDNEFNHKAWLATVSYFADDPHAINNRTFMEFAKFMQAKGLISKVQPMTTYLTSKD
jgi:putative hydroxymethylpyrimidine transport system substrate-binding protein